MKTNVLLLVLALGASTYFVNAQNTNAPADGPRPPAFDGGPGGPGGPGGGGPRRGGFHLLPPQAAERLNLTTDQRKQITALEADVKARLEKILTADQLQELEQMRPPRPQGRPGGPSWGRF
jgi:Spy/CpxP family protein refolding chaperone